MQTFCVAELYLVRVDAKIRQQHKILIKKQPRTVRRKPKSKKLQIMRLKFLCTTYLLVRARFHTHILLLFTVPFLDNAII